MNSIKSLLSAAQREQLTTADRLDFGSFKPYKPNNGVGQFIVELDARPLDALIETAQYGSRLYELMTISRPADVLHYLHLTMIDVHEDVLSHVQGRIKFRTRFKMSLLRMAFHLPSSIVVLLGLTTIRARMKGIGSPTVEGLIGIKKCTHFSLSRKTFST